MELEESLCKLKNALSNGRSKTYCLRLWSAFIRERDNNRCVICHSKKRLSAHHIIRKSFWNDLMFHTGNGITLCIHCHKIPHERFNRKPNLKDPMDSEGGDDIELLTEYLGELWFDSQRFEVEKINDYYFFDQRTLLVFKKFQGIPENEAYTGPALKQAYDIWNQTPRQLLTALFGEV